jgi:hypothetical protein
MPGQEVTTTMCKTRIVHDPMDDIHHGFVFMPADRPKRSKYENTPNGIKITKEPRPLSHLNDSIDYDSDDYDTDETTPITKTSNGLRNMLIQRYGELVPGQRGLHKFWLNRLDPSPWSCQSCDFENTDSSLSCLSCKQYRVDPRLT